MAQKRDYRSWKYRRCAGTARTEAAKSGAVPIRLNSTVASPASLGRPAMQQLSLNVSALLLISLLLYVLFRRTGDISNFCNLFSVPFGVTVIGAQLWFSPERSAFTPQPG